MRIKQLGVFLLGASVLAGLTADPVTAIAQNTQTNQAAPAEASQLQEIVVTAEKRTERLFDVPMAVTALEGKELQLRQITDLSGLVGQVPGLSIEQDSPESNRLILRGENTGGAGATVAITVDDVPFSYSSAEANGCCDTANFENYDMNRIEVLRGPQGTLYGATAEGGIVRYITNAPDPKAFSAGGEVGTQNVDQGQTKGDIKGFVNVPLSDTLAVRLVGYYDQLPGYIGNWVTGEKYANYGVREGGRVAVLWQPTDDFTARVGAFYQNLENHGSSAVDLVGQALTPASPPANRFAFPQGLSYGSQLPAITQNPTFVSYVNLQYDFHWALLTSITSYGQIKNSSNAETETNYFTPGLPLTLQQYLSEAVYGQPVVVGTSSTTELKKYNEELRLTSQPGSQVFGHDLEWVAGIFLTREQTSPFDGFFNVLSLSTPHTPLSPPFGSYNSPSSYDEYAAFSQLTYHFNPALDLSVGGRVTKVTQEADIFYGNGLFTTGLAGNLSLPQITSDESSGTWSVAPRWHLDKNNLIYVRVATGFRPGGPETPIPSAPPGYPRSYDSDSTVNYEIGWRSVLFDNTFSVDLAAYYIDWTSIQIIDTYASHGGIYTFTGNGGTARIDGVEWSFAWRPLEGLTLGVVGSWTDAELTQDATALGGAKGDKLPFVPDVTSSVNADYSWPWFAKFKGFVGGTWTYNGSVYTSFNAPGTTTELLGARAQLPAYKTLDLHAGIQDNNWTLQAYVKNLNNSHALLDYLPESGLGPNYSVYGVGPIIQPRTIGLRLAFNFTGR